MREAACGPGEHDAWAHGVRPLDIAGTHTILSRGGSGDPFCERRAGVGDRLGHPLDDDHVVTLRVYRDVWIPGDVSGLARPWPATEVKHSLHPQTRSEEHTSE